MWNAILSNVIMILVSIAIGMTIGIIIFSKNKYHGPNAGKMCQKTYYDKKTHQCFKFYVKPSNCPSSKTMLQKLYSSLKMHIFFLSFFGNN